jgi:hypothetical protein
MKEPYVEGLATHDDPESCAVIREDAGEALDRGTSGPGIQPRNSVVRGAQAVPMVGRQHAMHREREVYGGPTRSKTPCTFGTSMRENREVCGPLATMAWRDASGRP